VTTYTPTDRPYLDQLDDNIFVAGPGNGAAAKSSNEIGRAGALLVEHGRWNYDMEAGWFKAQHS
jgi:sarcosine oxidase